MKIILTPWTPNYVDCVPFSCNDSFHIVHNQANFKKSYSQMSKKHDQTAINLTNVFDFVS